MLTCKGCGRKLPAESFHRRKASTTGRTSSCCDCANRAARQRRLSKRSEGIASVDYAIVILKQLSEPERVEVAEYLRPDVQRSRLLPTFHDPFTADVRAVLNTGPGMRMLAI